MSEKKAAHVNTFKGVVVLLAVSLIFLTYYFDLSHYLTLDYLKEQRSDFQSYSSENPLLSTAAFMSLYLVVTALSLPGAALLTLAAGALFGLLWGTIMVSFASTFGATLSFLASRFLLGRWIQNRFSDRLQAINRGVEEEGAFYLLTLRLVPVFPFFLVNLLMGLTPIRTLSYFLVSQLGMFPGTIVYVNAGTELGQLESMSGILSQSMLFSFALLGLVPLVAKKGLNILKKKRQSSKIQ